MTSFDDNIFDYATIGSAPAPQTLYQYPLADTLTIQGAVLPTLALTLQASITIGSSTVYAWIAGAVIQDVIQLKITSSLRLVYTLAIADAFALSSVLSRIMPVAISSGLKVTDAFAAAIGVYLIDKLRLTSQVVTAAQYHLALADALVILGILGKFLFAGMTDRFSISGALAAQYTAVVSLVQSLTIRDGATEQLIFNMVMSDTITADDTTLLSMIYHGQLMDQIDLYGLNVTPNGNFTTFAINTRTNAISEYKNWVFNSFAQMGQKYIAAGPQGLYELNGARDITTNIIGVLRGGMMQMAGSKLAGLKGVYLAMTGEGAYLLKLKAGDGREYLYRFKGQPGMMTTKVDIGKGLKSRYLQWELISVGQNYDLDTIEFVPMIYERRV